MRGMILILLLCFSVSQGLFSQSLEIKDQSKGILAEIGINMNLPTIASKYIFEDVKIYRLGDMDLIAHKVKWGGDFLGLYLSLGVNFSNKAGVEFKYGGALNEFSYTELGWTEGFELTLKKFTNGGKFYWFVGFERNKYELGGSDSIIWSSYVVYPKGRWRNFVGGGFGVKLLSGIRYEFSVKFPLGDKDFYEKYVPALPPEVVRVKLLPLLNINVGYSFGVMKM